MEPSTPFVDAVHTRDAMTSARIAATAAALTTVAVAAACWVIAVRQMRGMDIGVGTELGSFQFFLPAWA